MKGQWIGTYDGSNTGLIVVNIDERSSYFEGMAWLNESNPNMPSMAASFNTKDKGSEFKFRTNWLSPINPLTGVTDSIDIVKKSFGDEVVFPKYADVTGSWNKESLALSWKTDIGTHGSCNLPCSKATLPSELVPIVSNWDSFRSEFANMEGRRFLFRGQNKPWRLRTSFHRADRFNLNRFVFEDIQMLHKHLSARTKHVFNLEIPNENGAFFNLVQHHGYPTPLLDWTYSPYVAAFFAYRGISNDDVLHSKPGDVVRIFAFNQELWKSNLNQLHQLMSSGPHVSVEEFLAVENERMIPQQAASTITNIDDIESYIKSKEIPGTQYLFAYDLPVKDRNKVIQQLEYMGITAGSLFPGLDGACEELRERNFRN
jgi:hypothetical protein